MKFEWDENKARANKAKHGVGFEAARNFDFDNALYRIDDIISHGEERWKAIGMIHGQLHVLIFTEREDRIRVISLRKADRQDQKEFYGR